jgi:hypothetical protein
LITKRSVGTMRPVWSLLGGTANASVPPSLLRRQTLAC